MENPATWRGHAERVVHDAIEAHISSLNSSLNDDLLDLSLERQITDALREAGLLEFVNVPVMPADRMYSQDCRDQRHHGACVNCDCWCHYHKGPARGDQVEAWLKRWRDDYDYGVEWVALDDALDDYRLHADTGTPLSEDVREKDVE